jgi:hypothetical protein
MPLLPPSYDPSPEEIAAACAALRRGWTTAERNRRSAGPIHPTNGSARRPAPWVLQLPSIELTPALAAALHVLR